jgi:hypothetical protein
VPLAQGSMSAKPTYHINAGRFARSCAHAVSQLEAQEDRIEPALTRMNRASQSKSRNRLADITIFMDSLPVLIGPAGFERDRCSADATTNASLRCGLTGACHDMVLLVDFTEASSREYPCNSSAKSEHAPQVRLLQEFTRIGSSDAGGFVPQSIDESSWVGNVSYQNPPPS